MSNCKRRFLGIVYYMFGFMVFIIGSQALGLGICPIFNTDLQPVPKSTIERQEQAYQNLGESIVQLFGLLICFVSLPCGFKLIIKGRRHLKIPSPVDFISSTDHILYLRCFNDDFVTEKIPGRFGSKTEEECLMDIIKCIGRPVAIGRPTESIPPLGAYRVYTTDDEWQEKIENFAKNARLIVFRLATSEGLSWEIVHCLKNIPDLSRLFFLIPFTKQNELLPLIETLYHIFEIRTDVLFSNISFNIPAKGTISSILYFQPIDENGKNFIIKQSNIPSKRWWRIFSSYNLLMETAWKPILQFLGKFNPLKYYFKRCIIGSISILFLLNYLLCFFDMFFYKLFIFFKFKL